MNKIKYSLPSPLLKSAKEYWEGCKFEIHYEHSGDLTDPTLFTHEALVTYNSKYNKKLEN